VLTLLHVLFVPALGFANAMVYGNLWQRGKEVRFQNPIVARND
jgi:hypothetical protein